MKTKKIVNISLCLGLVSSILLPNIVLPAYEVNGYTQMLPSNPSFQITPSQKNPPTEYVGNNEEYSSVILDDISVNENPISEEGLNSIEVNASQMDMLEEILNSSKKEIEELFKLGFTLGDVLKADDLAKKHVVPIDEILQLKKDSDLTFEEIDNNLSNQSIIAHLEKLKVEFPIEYNKLQNTQLSVKEQADLLSLYKDYQSISMDSLIENYLIDGEAAIENVIKNEEINRNPSVELVSQLGLTSEQAQNYSDEMLEKIEEIANDNNLSVEEVIEQLN